MAFNLIKLNQNDISTILNANSSSNEMTWWFSWVEHLPIAIDINGLLLAHQAHWKRLVWDNLNAFRHVRMSH